jgi:hypothetical protein
MIGKVRQWERQSSEDQPFLDEFLDDVILESDPWILQEYKRRVWPIIARGCATSGCHSGPKAADPVFFNERRMTDEMHYTNFLILQEYEDEDKRLINRGAPGDSLLVVLRSAGGGQSRHRASGRDSTAFQDGQGPQLCHARAVDHGPGGAQTGLRRDFG